MRGFLRRDIDHARPTEWVEVGEWLIAHVTLSLVHPRQRARAQVFSELGSGMHAVMRSPHLGIPAAKCHEMVVIALLHDEPIGEHDNAVGGTRRG